MGQGPQEVLRKGVRVQGEAVENMSKKGSIQQ